MSSARRLIFLGIFWSIFFLMHAFTYATVAVVYDVWLPYWGIIFGLLSFTFMLANMGVRRYIDNAFIDGFYYVTASWLGIVFVFFSTALFYELITLFIPNSQTLLSIFLALSGLFSVYALFNGKRLTVKEYEIPIEGLTKELSIVHLSDIHVGTVHQEKFLKRIVEKTNALSPDLVLVTGDLFDGSAPIDAKMLKPLDGIAMKSYFSTGNHEEYEGLKHVKETIAGIDMELLDSEVREFEGVQIIGVNDRQSIPREITLESILDKIPYAKDKPAILMYHTPVEWDSARKQGVDLMLSGHTHNGQIFPFTLLVRIQFKYLNGLYKKEDKYLHVSPGTGTWGPPMRLGSRNQIVLLKLVAK